MGLALKKVKKEGFLRRDTIMTFFHDLIRKHKDGKLAVDKIHEEINVRRRDDVTVEMPAVKQVCWIGDGPLLETDQIRFILRASGTDAVLRYYIEGKEKEEVQSILDMLERLNI